MTLNQVVAENLKKLNSLATGKGYFWDSSGKTGGSFGDVIWQGKTILRGSEDQKTYCCGITLQLYLMACDQIGKHIELSEVMKIYRKWFIIETRSGEPVYMNKGPVDALVPLGLAREIPIEEVQEGDFAQIWRQSGSGHSIAPITCFTDKGVKALKYWSSQPSTNGPGYRTEYFEGVKNPITHAWACRPI